MKQGQLVDGNIPKGHDCPFKGKCQAGIEGDCPHNRNVDFSCAIARSYEITEKNK